MPYAKHHKPRTRAKIVETARRLFSTQGFAATSIDDIMQACDLTRGGFYAHFRSKAELYRESLRQGLPLGEHGPGAAQSAPRAGDGAPLRPWALGAVFRQRDELAFLAADIGAGEPEVKAAYTEAVKALISSLQAEAPDSAQAGQRAMAAAAMLIGALAVSATSDDSPFTADLFRACRAEAERTMAAISEKALEEDTYLWAVHPRQNNRSAPFLLPH